MVIIEVSYPYFDIDRDSFTITDDLKAAVAQHRPDRGDVIHIIEAGDYRNDGKYMWNGHSIVPLGYSMDIDDYGYVPSEFTVGDEFLANHWYYDIDHNNYVWVDSAKYRQQLLSNLSHKGTHYTTPLGTFYINIHSHSPTAGMVALNNMINNNDKLLVEYDVDRNSPYHMYVTYSLDDELRDIHNGSYAIEERGNGLDKYLRVSLDANNNSNGIIYRIDDNDLYYRE